jgi:phage-related protein
LKGFLKDFIGYLKDLIGVL